MCFSGTNQKPERRRPFGTGLVRHCPQGLFSPFFTFLRAIFSRPFRLSLAPTICPWVSEDAFEEYRAKSQASGTQKETRERSSRVMGSLPAGYKITVCPSLHTSKTLDKIDGKNVAFSLIWEKRGLFFHFIPSKIEGGVGIGDFCYVVFPTNHNILTFWPAFISPLHYNLLVRNLTKVIIRRKVGKIREKGEAQDEPFFQITRNGCFKHSNQSQYALFESRTSHKAVAQNSQNPL